MLHSHPIGKGARYQVFVRMQAPLKGSFHIWRFHLEAPEIRWVVAEKY
jgi:hypothetical protein